MNLAAGVGALDADTLSGAVVVDSAGVGWPARAAAGTSVSASASSVAIAGLVRGPISAPFATEAWVLTVGPAVAPAAPGTALVWTVTRNWSQAVGEPFGMECMCSCAGLY